MPTWIPGNLDVQVGELLTSFLPSNSGIPWTSSNSLFTIWIGINDVRTIYSASNFTDIATKDLELAFNLTNSLYEAGARNFLFLDVPSIDRSPEYISVQSDVSSAIEFWNNDLSTKVSAFAQNRTDAAAILYSSNAQFEHVLDNAQYLGYLQV